MSRARQLSDTVSRGSRVLLPSIGNWRFHLLERSQRQERLGSADFRLIASVVLTCNTTCAMVSGMQGHLCRAFGTSLRAMRRAAGQSQRELAARTGLDFSYISKVENGRVPPPAADTAVEICRALAVEPDDLLALTRKIPSTVQRTVSSSPAAQQFLREAQQLALTDLEWRQLLLVLRRLRADC